jgi:predicted nucleotidyltransferase
LRALSAAGKEALGDNYVGMYIQGSLAVGDFDMTSDVDFITPFV